MSTQSIKQPILNAPAAVRWLVGATVLAHAVRMILPTNWDNWVIETFAFIPARYSHMGQPGSDLLILLWMPVTHLALHADWMHLILNMAFLLAFGSAIGRRMGAIQFLLFYAICGVVAAFFWFLFSPNSTAVLVGASGAISGAVGAAARVSIWPPRHAGSALPFWRRSTVIAFVAIWLGLNVVFGVFPFLWGDTYGGIAWQAHLGGFIAGFFLISAFDGRGRLEAIASSFKIM
jgi:membrane associated rhomboid family serine protease